MIILAILTPIISLVLLCGWLWAICRVLRLEQDYLWLWLMILLPPIGFPLYLINFFLLGDDKSGVTAMKKTFQSNRRAKELKEAIQESDIPIHWEELAEIYVEKEEWEEALKALKPALDADSENVKTQFMAAQCLIHLGKFEAALPYLEYLYQEHPASLSWQPSLYYAQTLAALDQPEKAEKVFRRILKQRRTPEIVYRFSNFLQRNEKADEACELLTQLIADYAEDKSLLLANDQEWLDRSGQLLKELEKS